MNEITSHQLLAKLTHTDMPNGTAIIKLGDQWISMDITDISVSVSAQFVSVIEIKGHPK